MKRLASIAIASCTFTLAGCDQKPAAPPAGSGSDGAAKPSATSPGKPAGESQPSAGAGHGGEIIELGSTKLGDLTLRASRDKGEIKAGSDAPIDLWVTTADGKPAAVTAVRFWIGTEDAKGSVKARAEIEDPKDASRWHTHAEIPNPLPDGAQLWVEIETAEGKKTAGFDLKR